MFFTNLKKSTKEPKEVGKNNEDSESEEWLSSYHTLRLELTETLNYICHLEKQVILWYTQYMEHGLLFYICTCIRIRFEKLRNRQTDVHE
jgi:hypothetical protein